ncbi:MAG: MBL fold metallo-hydrolase [Desulfobacterales bacterium]|nr:MBL fold metallo-hydrolase [Desulfobacterales bacterium]
MSFRVSPLWWPVLALSSPVLLPGLFIKNRRFNRNVKKALALNEERIKKAGKLELPELTQFELSVLVEQKAEQGFLSSPGVSYLIKTDQGSLLFDLGYGPETPVLASNAEKIGFSMDQVDAVVISHLHPDHMGGFKAVRKNQVTLPWEFEGHSDRPCFLPARASANGFKVELVKAPGMLSAGIASTGPLARGLFLMGWTEEQAIVARIKDKGLVVFTGCGHPTIETIIKMVRSLSDEPIYAIGGGLHFPVTDSPLRKPGLKVQMIWGTGKPPWKKITEKDLERTIKFLNVIQPKHVFLSAHDTCDYSINRFKNDLKSETTVLRAGGFYKI